MSERPKNLRERRIDDLENILEGETRVTIGTKYGTCIIEKHLKSSPQIYTMHLLKGQQPLVKFFIDLSTGELIDKVVFNLSSFKVEGKDKDDELSDLDDLTPEDLIKEFYETQG